MRLRYLFFTEKGGRLAEGLAAALGGEAERCRGEGFLAAWTESGFQEADGLVFVGAAGIAVRAAAPFLRSKATDPAIVVLDEGGNFAIPILSGHLGGANDLARKISAVCGAVPVITTATDVNGVFAVDTWAKKQGCAVEPVHKIKAVSAKLLAGEKIRIRSDWNIAGIPPKNVILTEEGDYDVSLSISHRQGEALRLIPRIAVLGIGCRKGTSAEKIEKTAALFLEKANIHEKALCMVTSIDLKKTEEGLLTFCEKHQLPFRTYTAEELKAAKGEFMPSAFVERVTGVDNVCERSAVLGGGVLYQRKFVGNGTGNGDGTGVTMALSLLPFQPDWRWENG